MKRLAYTCIQYLTALAVLLSSATSMVVQAGSIVSDGSFKMILCAPSGEQLDLWVDLELPEANQAQTACAYCLMQDGYASNIKPDLQFAASESISKTRSTFRVTSLPIIEWMQLPARAPPHIS